MCEPAFYSREARLQELLEQTRRDDAQARYRQAARRRGRPRATARGRARRGAIAPAQSPVRRGQQEEDERWKTLRAWDELAGWIVCADHRRRRDPLAGSRSGSRWVLERKRIGRGRPG